MKHGLLREFSGCFGLFFRRKKKNLSSLAIVYIRWRGEGKRKKHSGLLRGECAATRRSGRRWAGPRPGAPLCDRVFVRGRMVCKLCERVGCGFCVGRKRGRDAWYFFCGVSSGGLISHKLEEVDVDEVDGAGIWLGVVGCLVGDYYNCLWGGVFSYASRSHQSKCEGGLFFGFCFFFSFLFDFCLWRWPHGPSVAHEADASIFSHFDSLSGLCRRCFCCALCFSFLVVLLVGLVLSCRLFFVGFRFFFVLFFFLFLCCFFVCWFFWFLFFCFFFV
jgi:hypothetical protein